MGELITVEKLASIRQKLRDQDKKVKFVFTNGVFDLMHVGHVRFLNKAKSHGDVLIVGINSDESVRKIKGPLRPIVAQKYRAEMLCALPCVDYVVIFEESTPEKTIEALQPDVHVKGGDWKADRMPETGLVRSYGGKVVIEDSGSEITTTSLIKKIIEAYSGGRR
ncbi:MAG: D-glycero-beta-D-manno-heptose 1-phosphate adenylyltransferase [Candidatus ainarchaeum sp.]|nr:D-glycero-beta-D-manno-heptose 1-phosphate adenylyltransferase [Candidatus ainarchaeum sp.]